MDSNKKMGKFDIDIEIKDMLWEFMRRWRLIAVLAIVCGVGLGAYQYRADMNKTEVTAVKKTQEELEKSMATQDLDEVTGAVALKRQLDQKSAYMEASVLMHINPYEENAVTLQYHVSADEENTASDANDAYIAYVNNEALSQAIAETGNYEWEPVYLAELISTVSEEGNVYINAENATESINLKVQGSQDEHSFSVKVIGATVEDAEALANDVKNALENYSQNVVSTVGTHQLSLVKEASGVVVDQNLAELQNWNATAIKTISNNLDKMKNEMTGDQISLYVYRTTVTDTSATTAAAAVSGSTGKVVSISVKHIVIGIIVGTVLACGIIFVLYLFAAALRSSEEVKTLYGIKVLGCVDDTDLCKKKLFGFVDKFIIRLQNRRKKVLNHEQEVQMICANIVLDCKKNDCKKIYLLSSSLEYISDIIIKAVEAKCEEKGISVVVGKDICYDAETLEKVADAGNVVFVEKKRVALYDELYNEVVLCKEHGIHIIGMAVIGA